MQQDIRGTIEFELAGLQLQITPSFRNLALVERALNRGSLAIFNDFRTGNIRLGDVAAVVAVLAKPIDKDVKLPKQWDVEFVGDLIVDEGFDVYVRVVTQFFAHAMTAKSKKAPAAEGSEAGESSTGAN